MSLVYLQQQYSVEAINKKRGGKNPCVSHSFAEKTASKSLSSDLGFVCKSAVEVTEELPLLFPPQNPPLF